MTQAFVDTDVLIRFLTGDDPQKQASAAALLGRAAAGELDLAAPDTVIADAVYVLSSPRLYTLPRTEVSDQLSALIRLADLHIPHRRAVLRALALFAATRLDFGNALILSYMEEAGADRLYSHDRDFDRIAGIHRLAPEPP